jgi:hypothetical protein
MQGEGGREKGEEGRAQEARGREEEAEEVKSLDQMVKQCQGLIGTADVSAWESGFLEHIAAVVEARGTTVLTANQTACLERIYNKHFA